MSTAHTISMTRSKLNPQQYMVSLSRHGDIRILVCMNAASKALLADADEYDSWHLDVRTTGRGAGKGWKRVKLHPTYVEIRGITSHRREQYYLGFAMRHVARSLLRTDHLPEQVWVRLRGVS